MKSKKTHLFKSSLATTIVCGALISHFAATGASATDRYWDINGNTAGFTNIAGAWNGTNTFWNTSSAGGPGGTLVASPTSADDLFVTAGATGTIALTGTQSASSITLSAPVSKTISGAGTLTIGGTGASSGLFSTASTTPISTPIILNASSTAITYRNTGAVFTIGGTTGAAATGVTQTISAESNSGSSLTLNGVIGDGAGGGKVAVTYSGTSTGGFVVSGNSTYSGGTTINSTGTTGILAVTTATGFGTGTVTINGGSIRATIGGTGTTLGNAVTLGGNFTAATITGGEKNLTFTGLVTLTGNRTITSNIGTTVNTEALIFSGVIGDGGSGFGLTQNGTGNLKLSGANTYTGTTTVSAGTLTLGHATNTILNTAPVTVSGGTLNVANSDTVGAITITSGTISGVGTLTGSSYDLQGGTVTAALGGGVAVGKSTGGVANLGGTQIYTDATNVTAGTLNVTGTLGNTLLTVSNNARLGGEGISVGNVVFDAASGIIFDPNTTAANQYFRTTGNINTTAGAGTKINIDLTAVTTNTGVVVFEAGSITTNGISDFKLNSRGTLSLTATQLLFDFAAGSVVWKGGNGTNPTFWDVNTTAQNWTLLGVDDFFLGGDNVLFDDTASNFNPAVQAALAAGTVTFDNALANPYTLSGASVNATSVTKTDTGKVTISNAITLSGGTTISNGSIQLGDGTNATGSVTGAITNNGALITNFGANNVTLTNDISGSGSFTQAGAGTVILTGTNSYGTTTIDSGATLQIGTGGAVGSHGSGAITNNGTLVFNRDNSSSISIANAIGGTGSLTKQGAGALTLSVANGYTGATTISVGALIVTADGALGTNAAGTTLALGRSLGLSGGIDYTTTELISGYGAGTTAVNVGPLAAGNRGFIQSVSGNNTFRGNIELTLDGQSRIGTQDGASLTLTGAITQASGITTASLLFRAGSLNGDFVTLSNAGNSFGGDSQIFTGLADGPTNFAGVRLGVTNALPPNLTITANTTTGNSPSLDLAGFDQTLNGLIPSGTATLKIINLTGTPSTLTLNPTADKTSSTTILGGGILGVINLVKNGSFTQTLSGVNTYSGNTTVNAGTLSLGTVNANNEASTVTIAATAFLNLTHAGTDTVDKLFIGATQLAAGVYGNSSSVLPVIARTEITGTGTLTVTSGPPVTGYASWINGFFPGVTDLAIIGADADPDNDGIENGVEMVIGGNPATGMDTALLPTIELVTDPVSTPVIPAGNYLLFTYRRSDLSVAGSVTSACETDTDLAGTWTTAIDGASGVVIQVDDNFTFTPPAAAATDRVRVYVPRGANTTLFGRLDVVVP